MRKPRVYCKKGWPVTSFTHSIWILEIMEKENNQIIGCSMTVGIYQRWEDAIRDALCWVKLNYE